MLFLVFRYVPMAGIVLAWKQFTVTGGLFGSPWAGWGFFERLFASPEFRPVPRTSSRLAKGSRPDQQVQPLRLYR